MHVYLIHGSVVCTKGFRLIKKGSKRGTQNHLDKHLEVYWYKGLYYWFMGLISDLLNFFDNFAIFNKSIIRSTWHRIPGTYPEIFWRGFQFFLYEWKYFICEFGIAQHFEEIFRRGRGFDTQNPFGYTLAAHILLIIWTP